MLVMPPGAKRISSRATFFYKRMFPVFWFGVLGLFLVIGLASERFEPGLQSLPFIFMPLLIMVVGYLIVRLLLKDLVDEVWDNGKELLIVNEGHVEHVPLSGIVNISYSGLTNPKRATLQLRHPGRWGEKLSFIPPRSTVKLFGLMDNEMVDDLVRRVDEARRTAS